MRSWRLLGAAIAGVLLLTAAGAVAQSDEESRMTQRITAVFPESEAEIQSMRAAGYGWGVIIMILHLAQLSPGHDVAGIRAMFESGRGLGEIAQELNIHPGELGRIVAAVMSEGRSEEGRTAGEEGSGERGRPDWAGPPAGVSGGR